MADPASVATLADQLTDALRAVRDRSLMVLTGAGISHASGMRTITRTSRRMEISSRIVRVSIRWVCVALKGGNQQAPTPP